jgi:hypothetical protein
MRPLKMIFAAAIAAAAVLAFPIGPVSALTIYNPSVGARTAHAQIENAFYRGGAYRRGGFRRGGYGYRGGYGRRYGYGGAALVGGLAVGAAVVGRRCWINSYGYQVCN